MMVKRILIAASVLCALLLAYLGVSWAALTPAFDEVVAATGAAPRSSPTWGHGADYFRPYYYEDDEGWVRYTREDVVRKTSFIWPGGASMKVGLYRVFDECGVIRKTYDTVEVICVFEDGKYKVDGVIAQP
ncbi:hypothetical protein [Parvibacter caecicola]|uniref:hypothetical protein n=1 Tax=Parvibacter caecicola TaxID=747645 RepID=UPI00249AC53C|nr:hypothetical protein [Parvibacter caecicola]